MSFGSETHDLLFGRFIYRAPGHWPQRSESLHDNKPTTFGAYKAAARTLFTASRRNERETNLNVKPDEIIANDD